MATLTNLTVNDTGFIRLPSGGSAARPGSPTVGMIRYNTDLASNEYYNGSAWISVAPQTVGSTSTGGSIATTGGYRIHTFTSGSATFVPTLTGVVEVLVIAGGGAGHAIGGGGGAGGYQFISGVPVVAGTSYPTVVGTGGVNPAGHSSNAGNPGNPSTFGGSTPVSIVSTGGGKGGHYPPGTTNASGGSGGGGSGWNGGPETFHAGYEGTAGQGHPGGFGVHYNGTPTGTHYGGGGGGGAGNRGYGRSNRFQQGRGGEGMASNIGGTVTWRGGGGGGGTHTAPSNAAYSLAGRGSDGNNLPGQPGSPGGTNNGGGGGGGNHGSPDVSGSGGSGVVIVRYRG